jgi:hypothetical protein
VLHIIYIEKTLLYIYIYICITPICRRKRTVCAFLWGYQLYTYITLSEMKNVTISSLIFVQPSTLIWTPEESVLSNNDFTTFPCFVNNSFASTYSICSLIHSFFKNMLTFKTVSLYFAMFGPFPFLGRIVHIPTTDINQY